MSLRGSCQQEYSRTNCSSLKLLPVSFFSSQYYYNYYSYYNYLYYGYLGYYGYSENDDWFTTYFNEGLSSVGDGSCNCDRCCSCYQSGEVGDDMCNYPGECCGLESPLSTIPRPEGETNIKVCGEGAAACEDIGTTLIYFNSCNGARACADANQGGQSIGDSSTEGLADGGACRGTEACQNLEAKVGAASVSHAYFFVMDS